MSKFDSDIHQRTTNHPQVFPPAPSLIEIDDCQSFEDRTEIKYFNKDFLKKAIYGIFMKTGQINCRILTKNYKTK